MPSLCCSLQPIERWEEKVRQVAKHKSAPEKQNERERLASADRSRLLWSAGARVGHPKYQGPRTPSRARREPAHVLDHGRLSRLLHSPCLRRRNGVVFANYTITETLGPLATLCRDRRVSASGSGPRHGRWRDPRGRLRPRPRSCQVSWNRPVPGCCRALRPRCRQ